MTLSVSQRLPSTMKGERMYTNADVHQKNEKKAEFSPFGSAQVNNLNAGIRHPSKPPLLMDDGRRR